MRTRTALGAVVAGMLALPGAALAENGWEARFISQSAYLTLESGETGTSSFGARNIGTGTWDPSFVRLGDGGARTFLEDGDEVVLRGEPLGEVRGRILPSV